MNCFEKEWIRKFFNLEIKIGRKVYPFWLTKTKEKGVPYCIDCNRKKDPTTACARLLSKEIQKILPEKLTKRRKAYINLNIENGYFEFHLRNHIEAFEHVEEDITLSKYISEALSLFIASKIS